MTTPFLITRNVPLIDIEVGGDGRTVTAYAATFGDSYEVHDRDGHYDEVINAKAFNRTISKGAVKRAVPVFNHGLTLYGTPSERYSMPLGTVKEIKADGRGLLTVTRYAATPLADEVLELINTGGITGMSFRGDVYRSSNPRPGVNARPVIERMELGLKDFGPTPFPANVNAAVVAVRSEALAEELGQLTPEERRDLIAFLSTGISLDGDSSGDDGTQTDPPPDVATIDPASSVDMLLLAQAQRRRREALERHPRKDHGV